MLLDKVISRIQNYQKILLMIHQDPDGDTIAATVALFLVLKALGKEIEMVCKDSIPRPFLFLEGAQAIQNDILFGDFEIIIVIDCGDLKRTGFAERLKKFSKSRKNLINIDHHPKNDLWKIANINLVDQKVSSASEIVWLIIQKLPVKITKDITTAILTGIYTDTGGFKHSNTTPATLKIASELLNRGAKLKAITKNVALNRSVTALKLWGIVLSRLRKNEKLQLVSSVISREDLAKCSASQFDLAGVVNLMNSIPEAKATVLFYENADGNIQASLRTEKEDVDVSQIAKLFGGGGHKKAAGFTIPARLKLNGKNWEIVLR